MPIEFRSEAFIDGQWVNAEKRFPVFNPATQEIVAHVPDLGAADAERAIDAAHVAFSAWAALTAKDRGVILRRWFDLMTGDADRLARLITLEGGKPLSEAKGEVVYAASFIDWFAEEAK